jgi:hypothetical protein
MTPAIRFILIVSDQMPAHRGRPVFTAAVKEQAVMERHLATAEGQVDDVKVGAVPGQRRLGRL